MVDIFDDDLRYLDAMEVFSKIGIGDIPRIFGPFLETIWQLYFLSIPDKPFKVTEGVEGLLHAARLLLDAAELGHMLEPVCAVIAENLLLLFEEPPFLA